MPDLVGQALNRYQMVSLLGEGGMGAVYKAQDTALKREVAVKVLHSHFARQPDFRERFLQEARTAARLDHAGIVKVFDFGEAQGQLYIVMELIAGENLQDLLTRQWGQGQGLTPQEASQLTRQIALSLDYLHKQGILHRDIKPANIMLKPESLTGLPYRPVLTDLGLARLLDGPRLTQDGGSMGTPAYMSPEQASGMPTDARSDVYSLGILLFELATGRLPFPIHTITEAIRYHTREVPPSPRTFRPELPQNLEQVILRAIAKEPASRFADAAALAQALEQAILTFPPPGMRAAASPSMPASAPAGQQRPPAAKAPGSASIPPDTNGIQVIAKNHPNRFIPIKPKIKDMVEMSIGRDESADICLDSPGVSRKHAKLTYDGSEFYLTDLNSTNRTFLGDTELLPGVAERWNPEKVARIGTFALQLVLAGQKAAPIQPPSQPPGERAGFRRTNGSLVPVSPGFTQMENRIWVDLEEEDLTVEAGGRVPLTVNLLNQGGFVDQFHVSVKGIPAAWYSVQPPVVNLMPGDQATAQITFHPPRNPSSQAKAYPLEIRVTPEKPPKKVSTATGTLTVLPFYQSRSEMHPMKIKGRKPARVTIQNQGNIADTYTAYPADRADELIFDPPQKQVQVAEGQQAAVEFRARPRATRIFGMKQTHSFTIQVSSAQGGNPTQHMGEFTSTALIPPWLPIFLMGFCALLMLAASQLIPLVMPKTTPTSTGVIVLTVIPDTLTPSPLPDTPTAPPSDTPTLLELCAGAPEPRVEKNGLGRVGEDDPRPLRVRKTAEYTGDNDENVIAKLPPGTQFRILDGPECVQTPTGSKVLMWKIEVIGGMVFDDGTTQGWVVEADSSGYFIEPLK